VGLFLCLGRRGGAKRRLFTSQTGSTLVLKPSKTYDIRQNI